MLAILLAALETDEERHRFTEIYIQTHVRMEQVAARFLKEQQDVEDAVQNAYMQVIRHFHKIDEIPCKDLPFWIISIVKNEAMMILRGKRRVIPLEDWDGYVGKADDVTDYSGIVHLFSELPETYRATMEMKFLLGYSSKEIAKHLRISESAVNTRVFRGRELLQSILEREGYLA